jgi:hypothetical protein
MKTALKATDMISKLELASIKRDRKKLEALRAQCDALEVAIRCAEEYVIGRMEAGVPVDGEATILTRRRQNISWLTVVKRELGKEAIVRVKDKWPVSFYKVLQIA